MKSKVLKIALYRHRLLSLAIILLSSVLPMTAQTGKLYNADQQLSSSFTNQVYLDREGFIWVVTRNGMNKYDGYQFHIIKKELNKDLGMASNYVNCMMQDQNGLFYVGMYGSLQTYDGNRFKDVEVRDIDGRVVPCYMTCFLQRKNGEILAGTSGHGLLKIINPNTAQQQNGGLRNIHTIHSMVEDRNGHVWLATNDNGILEYDGKTVKHHMTSEEQRSIFRTLCLDMAGNIYAGTTNSGVFTRPARGGSFTHIEVTGTRQVSALYGRRDGRLMIGYDGQGVAIYDPRTGELTDNPYYSREVDLTMSKV